MERKTPCVYILTNKPRGVLYTGITTDLPGRIYQHRQLLVDGFSCRYKTTRLVWFEIHDEIYAAITREKQIKKWERAWKIEMIESSNSNWADLYDQIAC